MRVMCIGEWDFPSGYQGPCPQLYAPYTVVGEEMDEGMRMYELAEFPRLGCLRFTFEAEGFVPLDGPDETALLEERFEAEGALMDIELTELINEIEHA